MNQSGGKLNTRSFFQNLKKRKFPFVNVSGLPGMKVHSVITQKQVSYGVEQATADARTERTDY